MTILLKLSQLIDALNRFVGKAVIWLILASTVISALNAVVRKIFHTSSNAYLEVQWYLFAWAFLLAAGYTLLRQEHVKIDVLYGTLKRRTQVWIEIFGFLGIDRNAGIMVDAVAQGAGVLEFERQPEVVEERAGVAAV